MKKIIFFILMMHFSKILSLDRQSTQRCCNDNDTDILKTAHLAGEESQKLVENNYKDECKKRCQDYKVLFQICFVCSTFLLKELLKKVCCCKRN